MQTISTTDLAHRLRPVLTRLARRMRQEASGDLSPTQGAALATIDCHGPPTPSELATRERIQRPTATRVLARLGEAGPVARAPPPPRPPPPPGPPAPRRPPPRGALPAPRAPGGPPARGGGGLAPAPRRSRRSPLLAGHLDPGRPRPAGRRPRPQRRVPGSAARPLEPRRPRRARSRRGHPRAGARRVTAAVERTFSSLKVPNYRRYFGGQVVSITGNWMQIVGEMWLMVKLPGSGVSVGLTAGLQFLPVLLFGAYGGLLADRMPKRRLLTYTQLSLMVPALTLFSLAATGAAQPWMGLALVFVGGTGLALDNPGRQSFVVEIVGADRVVNAVALNSVVVHCSRILGPALAGTIIALIGIAPCFAVNAASFLGMLIALRTMDPSKLLTPKPVSRKPGE